MIEIPFFIPLISGISSFIIILIIRYLDVFEKEPYKLLFLNFIFGIIGYLISLISVSSFYKVINFNNLILNYDRKYIFISVLISAVIMLISQLIFASLSFIFFQKEFDTMPDYIIYFSTIGIGYNFGEVFFTDLLNNANNQFLLEISNNLYFSSFFNGSTLPFLMAAFGGSYYLYLLNKNQKFNKFNKLAFFIMIAAFFTQLVFYTMNCFITIESIHTPSDFLNIVKEVKLFAQNFSVALLISSVGFSVIFDAYIISSFLERTISKSKLKNFKGNSLSVFINPFSYLPISKLNLFFALKKESIFKDKEIKSFAKLALKEFNDKENESLYIKEAESIIFEQ